MKKCLIISSQPLFRFVYRFRRLPKMTVSCSPHCHLERSCMSIWEQRYLALLRLWVERSPPQCGLGHWEREISPLRFASVEMTIKRGECLCQFVPCRPMIRRLLPNCLTIQWEINHFFTAPGRSPEEHRKFLGGFDAPILRRLTAPPAGRALRCSLCVQAMLTQEPGSEILCRISA